MCKSTSKTCNHWLLERSFLSGYVMAALLCLGVSRLDAQVGVSSASLSMGRAGLAPDPDAILVHEYFNFHRHQIPQPRSGESIGFDVRWGAKTIGADKQAFLQVGLATRKTPVDRELRPLNITLVIDCSGSMSGYRIANVKRSILSFVERLRPVDQVSVVAFNQAAQVVLDGREDRNQAELTSVIESISAGGSTNLHAGLMLGLKQVSKSFDSEKTNRVVLLTDGRANSGVTDQEQIAQEALVFNKRGIDVSTIGLGNDLNHQLLRQLAKSGRGLIHFVDNAKDIRKVFVDELESLISPVAREVVVEIEYEDSLKCAQFYGYEPEQKKNRIVVRLDDLNHHATQVLLVRFTVAEPDKKIKRPLRATARLRYLDIDSGKRVQNERRVDLAKFKKKDNIQALEDLEVRKNVTIAELAQAIKEMAFAYQNEDYSKGSQYLLVALAAAQKRFPESTDKDISRVQKIAQTYLDRIIEFEVMEKRLKEKRLKEK